MKHFVFVAFSLMIITACENSAEEQEKLPNVIFILADDMGYGDVRALNPNSGTPTTNIDQLLNEGMHFTDAHSNAAVCTPTRYGLLTGRYAFRTRLKSGVLVGYDPPLIAEERLTLGGLFSEASYNTAAIGKWHLGLDWPKKNTTLPLLDGDQWSDPGTENVDYDGQIGGGPTERGFDYSYIIPSSLDIAPYCYISNGKLTKPITSKIEFENSQRGVFWRASDLQQDFKLEETLEHLTTVALDYIEEQATDKENPFFLYLPLTAPHTPWLPNEAARGKSEAGVYGDFVVQVDQSVGAIMQKLEALGIEDETLIVFTSDNGAHWTPADKKQFAHRANHVFRGMKSDALEGGHRVPFIVRWPGNVNAGTVNNEIVSMTDMMATFADLTQQLVEVEDSNSILNLLLNKDGFKPREYTINHGINGTFAVRKGKWKLIDAKGSGGWTDNGKNAEYDMQLYDLEKDIREENNLVADYPDLVKELKTVIDEYKKL
jgi:arylsulfatase A-like enzyme